MLWHSNAPWTGTGYGKQTGIVLRGLLDRGHDPTCLAYYGLKGGVIPYDGYQVWPNSDFEEWGNDVIQAHVGNTKAEAVVSLIDLFVLDEKVWSKLGVPWVAWVPIDHEEIGHPTLKRLKRVSIPVAMSDFGAVEMMKAGIEEVIRIYHAVDTDIYQPLDKSECRAEFSVAEDAYVVGMVMANKGDRKQIPQQLLAVKRWADENPGRDVRVFIYTDPTSKMGGWDLKSLVAKVGLKGQVYSALQYFTSIIPLPDETMAKIFNTFDVLMNASAGEGFGVPIIEAQACGVPVVAGNYTSMPELVHNGYVVEPESRVLGHHYGYQYIPSLDDLVYRLECVYRNCDKRTAQIGRDWVEQNCSVPVICDQWAQLFDSIATHEPVSEELHEPELTASVS